MSVFISKNAIDNIPIDPQEINDTVKGVIQNPPLVGSHYLEQLAKNDVISKRLKLDSSGGYIIRVKMALIALAELNVAYTFVNPLDTESYKFDNNLRDAVIAFQVWQSINPTGIIDSETLLAMDRLLSPQNIFDHENKKYKGQVNDKPSITINSSNSSLGTTYEIIVEGGNIIQLQTTKDLNIKPISKDNNALINGKVNFVPYGEFNKILGEHPTIKLINDDRNKSKLPPLSFYSLDPAKNVIKKDNASLPLSNINDQLDKTPPLLFNDQDAKLYEIKPGDTTTQIVIDNYYGGGNYAIMDPYNNIPIITIPEHTPLSVQNRSDDARFQFYLNLLYYYNSNDNNGLKEWGLKKGASYQRYPVNHLDDVNIFDNIYDPSSPQTALPNYYRFLKKMETLNPASTIIFDNNGNTTSFVPDVGKNIRIPSRKFADSMYYFLNFRHSEVMQEVIIPPQNSGDDPTSMMDYLTDQAIDDVIDVLDNAMDSISSLATEVKDEAIELYHESVDFMKKAYNFAIDVLTDYWPRGAGGTLGFEGSVTWGIPIKTKGRVDKSLYRKTSKENELTIIYNNQFLVDVGVDISVGGSAGIGHNSGHGKSKRNFGIGLEGNVSSGIEVVLVNEYEFPIRKDETALLSMIINVFGGTLVSSTADILEYLEVINLNPRQYLAKMETSIELYGNVTGSAYIANASLSTPTTNQEPSVQQNKNKSFASIDNIFSKIPGIGINATAGFNTGFKFSYEVDYGDNPHTTDREGRVFKTADLDIQFYFGTHLNSGLLGNIFQTLFVGMTPPGMFLDTIFDAINFDKGILLGVNYCFKRTSTADTIENNDFQFTQLDATLLNMASGSSLRYITPGDRIDKEISLYFGTFSGDVDALCDLSSEVKYNINIGTLYKMWHQGSNYDYNFQNVFSLFRSISFRKKVGAFDINTSKTKILSPKVADKGLTNQVVDAHNKGDQNNTEVKLTTKLLSASLDNVSKDNFFFEGGLALDIQMEIDLGLLSNAFEFYFKNLYYKYSILLPSQYDQHNKSLISQIGKINQLLKDKAIYDNVSVVEGQEYYDILYSDGMITGANSATEKGLLKFIKDKIGNTNINNSNTQVIYRFLKGVLLSNEYLNGKQPSLQQELDYGINKILDFFSYITSMGNLQVTLEAKAGVSFGGHLRVGKGLTAALALEALAEINYQGILFQNGVLTDLDVNDPLRAIYQEIRIVLGLSTSNKKIGAKTIFNLEKK